MLRTGLAGSRIGDWATNAASALTGLPVDGVDGDYTTVVTDPVKGDPLSLDTGATYLPLQNVKYALHITSSFSGSKVSFTYYLFGSVLLSEAQKSGCFINSFALRYDRVGWE